MSWSLNTWDKGTGGNIGVGDIGVGGRLSQAGLFLNKGTLGTAFGGTGCTSSSQCGSGFKCSGGKCVPIKTSGGSAGSGGTSSTGGLGGGGSCDGGPDGADSGTSGTGGSGCSSPAPIGGGSTGCTTSTCGQGSQAYGEDSDCCGERCCRYFATGIPSNPLNVNCFCGNCPGTDGSRCGAGYSACGPGLVCVNGFCNRPKLCNKWCTEYYEANGELGPGCSRDQLCDECTECTGAVEGGGNYCAEKSSVPCHCNTANLSGCQYCDNDGSIKEGGCQECCELLNYDCGCGKAVNARVCRAQGASGLSQCNLAQIAANEACQEACDTGGPDDPCAGVLVGERKISCIDGGSCDDSSFIPVEDGSRIVVTGCIQGGGQTCFTYEDRSMIDVPEECKACDCNCHNDCPPCQLCGADGKCYPDPSCTDCGEGEYCPGAPGDCCPEGEVCYQSDTDGTRACCAGTKVDIYTNVVQTDASGGTATYFSVGGPIQFYITDPCGCPTRSNANSCGGFDVPCDSPQARDWMVMTNEAVLTGPGTEGNCTGGRTRCVSFRDELCDWDGGPFTPVLISTTYRESECCTG